VIAAAAAIAACAPGGLGGGAGFLGGGTGGGTGGASSVATQLLGSWRNTRIVATGGDTIITETVWTFSAGGSCSKAVSQTSVSTGNEFFFPTQSCAYTVGGSSVTVTFAGSSVPTTFSVAFSSGTLILDGFPFQRIG